MMVRIYGNCKGGGVRQNNATGNSRMARMCKLPVVQGTLIAKPLAGVKVLPSSEVT